MQNAHVTATEVHRHRTAMTRTDLSKPVTLALEYGVLGRGCTFFDYGCGRGYDVDRLVADGFVAAGWDPAHAPANDRLEADVVNLGYVLNVIEDPPERIRALAEAWKLAKQTLVVAVRPDWEVSSVGGRAFGDGIMTTRGTFQKFFGHEEFSQILQTVTGQPPTFVAPGIAFVFRQAERANDFRIRTFRRRGPVQRLTSTEAQFNSNRELLEPLLSFIEEHGRLPDDDEVCLEWNALREKFGSLRAAFGLVKRATGEERWALARTRAEEDLSLFLALMAFGGRPRWSDLSIDLQRDVRALFGSYKSACADADRLLYSLGDEEALDEGLRGIRIGKVLPDAVYVHKSSLGSSSALIRLYEGCARILVGEVPRANIIKLSRKERRVSYMSYPTFDREAHPALAASLRIDLRTFSMKFRDYTTYENPPILHRKELLVKPDYPRYELFARLTEAEERRGLLARNDIGMRKQWLAVLAEHGLRLRGHRLVPVDSTY